MDNGTIGIMVGSNSLRKLVLRKYMDCNTTRMKLFSFTSFAIDWDRKKIKGLQLLNHKWVESTFSFPKVVYNRCYNVDVGVVKQLENVIGINKCFNHINQLNKLETYTHLSRWLNPHLPETVPYDKGEAARLLDVHKLLYIKPCYGQMGKGVYRVEKKASGEIHISSHHFLPVIIAENIVQFEEEIERLIDETPYLIQKGVPILQLDNRTFDIRVLAQKNKLGLWTATNVVSRMAYQGCFNTSICEEVLLSETALQRLYPSESVKETMNSIYNISLRSAEIIELDAHNHLCELSVDLALDTDGHLWIIEVNGQPQKSLYDEMPNHSKFVYSRPLEYAQYLHNQ